MVLQFENETICIKKDEIQFLFISSYMDTLHIYLFDIKQFLYKRKKMLK